MQKIIIAVIILCFITGGVGMGCSCNYVKQEKYSLYIDETLIASNITVYWGNNYDSYAMLPFFAVLDYFGASVKWFTESIVIITIENLQYLFDMKQEVLYKENNAGDNLLHSYPGGKIKTAVYNGKFFIDDVTLLLILKHELDINVETKRTFSKEQQTIRIQTVK